MNMKSIIRWFSKLFSASSSPTPPPEQYQENMGVRVPDGVSMLVDPVLVPGKKAKRREPIPFQEELWTLEFEDGSLFKNGDIEREIKLTATVLKYLAFKIDSDAKALLKVRLPDPSAFPEKTKFISDSDSRSIRNFEGWNSTEFEILKRFEFGQISSAKDMEKEGLIGPSRSEASRFPLNYRYKQWLLDHVKIEILQEFKKTWEYNTHDLQKAASRGNEDLVDFLLRTIESKDYAGVVKLNLNQFKYSFLKAVENKHFECANMIFPFVDYFDITRYLRDAVRNKDEDKARYLLKVMVFMEDLNQVHHAMLFMCTQEEDYWIRNAMEIVEPEFRPADMMASIGRACDRKELIGNTRDSEIAQFEKKRITPENKLNTPLVDAAENGLSSLVEERIPGADTKSLNSALCRAIKQGYLGIVRILIDNGADPFCYRGLPEKHVREYGRLRIGKYLEKVIESRRN